MNATIKSGTNNFHGSVYEFLRNDKLDARNFFLAQKAPYRQNQFGVRRRWSSDTAEIQWPR